MLQDRRGGDDVPDCCKVKTSPLQPTLFVAPPPAPDLRAATQVAAGEVVDAIVAPAAREVLARADHVPLKFPHGPTYLRISVLLI